MSEATHVNSEDLDVRRRARLEAATKLIRSSAGWSAAAGVIPLPFVDVASIGAVQVTLIQRIAELYDQPMQKEVARSIVAVLLGTLLPANLAAGSVGSALKLIPGIGSLLGAASLAVLGSAATYAIGRVFVNHFEGGGTLSSLNLNKIKDDVKKEFDDAKETAGTTETVTTTSTETTIQPEPKTSAKIPNLPGKQPVPATA